jgi:hypothetical protein
MVMVCFPLTIRYFFFIFQVSLKCNGNIPSPKPAYSVIVSDPLVKSYLRSFLMLRKSFVLSCAMIVASAVFMFAPSTVNAAPACSSFLTDKVCDRFTYRCDHGYRGQSGKRYCHYLKRTMYWEQRMRRDCSRKLVRGRYHPCKDIERRERYVASYNKRHPSKRPIPVKGNAPKGVDPALKAKLASLEAKYKAAKDAGSKIGILRTKLGGLNKHIADAGRDAGALRGLEETLRSHRDKLNTREGKIKRLRAEIQSNESQNRRFREDISKIEGHIAKSKASLSRLEGLRKEVGRTNKEIQGLQRLAGQTRSLGAQISAVKSQMARR